MNAAFGESVARRAIERARQEVKEATVHQHFDFSNMKTGSDLKPEDIKRMARDGGREGVKEGMKHSRKEAKHSARRFARKDWGGH